MRKLILPSEINGGVVAPASKSLTIRALAAALLADGETELVNTSLSNDALAALHLVRSLGGKIDEVEEIPPPKIYPQSRERDSRQKIKISGGFPEKNPVPQKGFSLSCGESALTMRLFAAVVALQPHQVQLRAEGTLRRRPMDMVERALAQVGVECRMRRGFPPLEIRGPMKPGRVILEATRTSQVLSGLLLALPLLDGDSEIKARGLKSRPYVELTTDLIQKFGINCSGQKVGNDDCFFIPGKQRYRGTKIAIEGDWSAAAFFLVAGALAGRVKIEGLNPNSKQADRRILEALKAAGAKFLWSDGNLVVEKSKLRGFEFDAADCPDLFPPLCVLALGAEGHSRIWGAGRLIIKESNRAAALISELTALGGKIAQEGEAIVVEGGKPCGGECRSWGDHRVVMAAAVVGLISEEGVKVDGSEAVAKSFPDFFEKLAACGGKVQ